MLNYFFQLYYEQDNCNLFIIHFKVEDTKHLKYIKFQLDDYQKKENNGKKNKIFVFIIHIEKNYKNKDNSIIEEKKDINSYIYLEKYYSFFLSFLSEFQQITIDNLLINRNISILDLYNKQNEELIIESELLDIKAIIKKQFSTQLTQMSSSQAINLLISKLDNFDSNGILICIIDKIKNTFKNYDNLLKKYLLDYSSLEDKDFDFISYFIERLEKLISENVNNIIHELGRSGFLVSFIFEKDIPQKIKNIIIQFIENLNLSMNKIEDKIDNYFLDLKIPASRMLIQKLLNLIKNCKIDYLNKENEYRKITKKKNEKSTTKLEDVYFAKMKYIKNRLYNEELLDQSFFNEYSQDIMEDLFCLLFYKEKNILLNKKEEEFLLYLYEKKITEGNILERFLYFFLWIGSYHEIIIKFVEILKKFDKYFIDKDNNNLFLEHLKDIYEKINLPYEGDKEKEKVNGIFYKISEAIYLIITNVEKMDYIKVENLQLLCTDFKETFQAFSQFNTILNLSLRDYYSLNSISKLIEYYLKNGKNIKLDDFKLKLNNFIKYIFEEKNFISSSNIEKAKESFKEQLKITMNFSDELSMKIVVNKLLQYSKNVEYKIELINIIFDYPKLLKFSTLFFNYIFLIQPSKPKKQIKSQISENEKKDFLQNFGEIKNKFNDKILKIINKKAENNEILKEILLYVFELRIISYFEDCQKLKFIQKSPEALLIGLNFEYFKTSCNYINGQEFGKLKTLGMIFYFSYVRCYLYHFVKLQIENKNFGEIKEIHKYLMDNTELGLLLILYISNLFISYDKKKYDQYLKDETEYNWKAIISSRNDELLLFPILNYENSKHLLFSIWAKLNKNNLSEDFIKKLDIKDLSYIINFSCNEMNLKNKKGNLEESKLLTEINRIKNSFSFENIVNQKIKILFERISELKFFENLSIDLNLIFIMINFYIIGFAGNKKRFLFSLLYTDNITFLIKLLNQKNFGNLIQLINSYYEIKNFLEIKYIKENKYFPIYICNCKRWHYIENYLTDKIINCGCGLKIGGKIQNPTNIQIIFYDEKQQKEFENRQENENLENCSIKGKFL